MDGLLSIILFWYKVEDIGSTIKKGWISMKKLNEAKGWWLCKDCKNFVVNCTCIAWYGSIKYRKEAIFNKWTGLKKEH